MMELMEERVLRSFRKYMSKSKRIQHLDLFASFDNTWGKNDVYECVVEDSRIDGPAWNVVCDAFGNVYKVFKLGGYYENIRNYKEVR